MYKRQYQDGKILRFNNGHEVDIKVLDLPKTEKIEWTVSLDGQDQTVNFLGQEKDKSMIGEEGRYLNFYVPYGYRGDILSLIHISEVVQKERDKQADYQAKYDATVARIDEMKKLKEGK